MQIVLPASRGSRTGAACTALVVLLAALASMLPAQAALAASTPATTSPKLAALTRLNVAKRAATKACTLARTPGAGHKAQARCTLLRKRVAAARSAVRASGATATVAAAPAPAAATPGALVGTGAAGAAPAAITAAHPAASTAPAAAPAPAAHTTTATAPPSTPPHASTASTPPTTAATTTPAPTSTSVPATPVPPTTTDAPAPTTTSAPVVTTAAPTTTTATDSSTTPPAAGTRLYAADSPFNTPIGAHPKVDGNSAAMVAASVTPFIGNANFANNDWWGIPVVTANGDGPVQSVGTFDWGYGGDIFQPAVHIPTSATPSLGDDHHLVVLNGTQEMDMWAAQRQDDGSFEAGARVVTSTTGSGVAAQISGNAAGFALGAGLVRPEDYAAGRIDHALTFTSPYIRNTFVAPAVHGDGRQDDPDAMPMGTRIQLDPDYDISNLPTTERIMAQALKDYGAYLTDTGGSLAVYGEASSGRASMGGPSDIWTPVGVTDPSLRDIPWDHVRVIEP